MLGLAELWGLALTLPCLVQSPWNPHSGQLPSVSLSHLLTVRGAAPLSEFALVSQEKVCV